MSSAPAHAGAAGRAPARDVTGPDGWVRVSRNVWIKKGFTYYDATPYIIVRVGDKEIKIYAASPNYHGDLNYTVYRGNEKIMEG